MMMRCCGVLLVFFLTSAFGFGVNSIHTSMQKFQLQESAKLRNDDESLLVSVDDEWFDLSEFNHPGGDEVLRRHRGQDITYLFYSNHWDPDRIKESTVSRRRQPSHGGDPSVVPSPKRCPFSQPHPHTELYKDLKRRVKLHLDTHNIPWRHQPNYNVFFLRAVCLGLCLCGRELHSDIAGSSLCIISAMTYGLLTGRTVWTHIHNGVHNPSSIPPNMRLLLEFDCVAVVSLWMHEHLTHHAETNTGEDPDMFYFSPLFDYKSIAQNGGSTVTKVLAVFAYPLLIPFMLVKSILHADKNDPMAGSSISFAILFGPLRFGLDYLAMGENFFLALATATAYILFTFAATHQVSANHAPSSGDWMLDQLRSTNSVWSKSRAYSTLTGGISNHVEHHIFPHVSSHVLVDIAPVVEAFVEEHGFEYNSYSPWELVSEHMTFVGGDDDVRTLA